MLTFLQTAATTEGSVAALDKVQELIQQLTNWGISTGKQIIAALIIFLVGRLLISVVNKLVAKLRLNLVSFLGSTVIEPHDSRMNGHAVGIGEDNGLALRVY